MSTPYAHTILLVEDNDDDVLLLKRACTKAGLANPIHRVPTGDAAIAFLAACGTPDQPDHRLPTLVLLDLKLPGTSGLEVLAWIRDRPELKRLPVVVLTSSSETPDINRAYDLGANSYLVKPGSQAELIRVVASLGLYWLVLNRPGEVGWTG